MDSKVGKKPEIIKLSEVNPETSECIRVILLKNSPNLYILMMEGFINDSAQKMTQLGVAKTFKSEEVAAIHFDYLVDSLATAWEV